MGKTVVVFSLLAMCPAIWAQSNLAGTYQGPGSPDTVAFGGPPYCSYSVTMNNVMMSVTVDSSGAVTAATASALMTESAPNGCPYPLIPPNTHTFTGTGTIQGATLTIQF